MSARDVEYGSAPAQPSGLDDVSAPIKPVNLNAGHRDRARNRFAKGGDQLEDYEVLELLLFQTIARGDTKATAKRLLQSFRTVAGVLGAKPAELMKIEGVGKSVAFSLNVVGEVTARAIKSDIHGEMADLGSWSKVISYCQSRMGELQNERLRVLYLNKRNKLMGDEQMQEGTVDHTPAYPREIVRRALEVGATAIVLVHNHPSGDPTPSRADIELTRQIDQSCKVMNISLHDHIIVGRENHASMKALQLF